MRAAVPIAAALLMGAVIEAIPVAAQPAPGADDRIRRIVVYGNDPCPQGEGGEAIVCARRPERDRYRIPEGLRTTPPDPENESWAARAEALEYVGRTGIQSCSPVGPGGHTGCWDQIVRQYRADREAGATPEPQP